MAPARNMPSRRLGRSDVVVPALGFGSFKIGRNQSIKYARAYDLPGEDEAATLLNGVLDLGSSLIDTAPAYGCAEARIGRHLAARRSEFVLSTKVGEQFEDGISTYDFTPSSVEASARRSVERLGGPVDILLVHADADDLRRSADPGLIASLVALREAGLTRLIGFSGRSETATRTAFAWADVVMIEYHHELPGAAVLLAEAHHRGIGTMVKKALASGRHDAETALRFALENPHVDSVIVGGLNLSHLRQNVAIACAVRGEGSRAIDER